MTETATLSPQIEEAHGEALAGSFTIHTGAPVDIGAAGEKDARTQEWQVRAWRYWHKLGELRFPTSHLARQVTRIIWNITENGNELDPKEAKALIDAVTVGLGEDEASRLIALNLQVAGEGNYVKVKKGGEDVFRVLSVVDPNRKDLVAEGKANGLSLRFLSPDPTDTEKAESAVMTALGPAEELITLEHLSRAQSRSRITQSGILIIPDAQAFPAGTDLGRDITEAASQAIKDERSPAAVVPIVLSMDKDLIEKVRHMFFERPYDDKIMAKIELAQRRIAMTLDIEPETLLGSGDLNHWSLWGVTEEKYVAHVEPLAVRVGEVFAAAIRETMNRDVDVIPDGSKLLARRSTVRDALDAYQATPPIVSAKYVRESMGATDEDAATDEEIALRMESEDEAEREPTAEENPTEPVAASLDYTAGAIAAAVAMATTRAREKVGAKLRSKISGASDRVMRTPNAMLATVMPGKIDEIDTDRAILEALDSFVAYYATLGAALDPADARLLVAEHARTTLTSSNAKVPDTLIDRLREGL